MSSTIEGAIDSKTIKGDSATEDMGLESGSRGGEKREGEEEEKVACEKRLKLDDEEGKNTESESNCESVSVEGKVKLGPKEFASSVEMFDYFFKLLHSWSPNLDLNQYEHIVLINLLKKGHPDPDRKTGEGIQAFQVRYHPLWKSKCFFLIRTDGTCDDFSFRKCVDHILSLPENMKPASISNGRGYGGGKGGGRGGRGRGRRGGKN